MSLALRLPPRFLAPTVRPGSRELVLSLLGPVAGILADLLGGFILRGQRVRGGGRKHQHPTVRKRNTDPQKLFKEQKNISTCPACGRPKLAGLMCLHCITYMTQQFKAARRAELDRPTLNDEGLLITSPPDPERMSQNEHRQWLRSIEARTLKYDKLKQDYDESVTAERARRNARRAALGLPALNEQGQVPTEEEAARQRPGVVERWRERAVSLFRPRSQ